MSTSVWLHRASVRVIFTGDLQKFSCYPELKAGTGANNLGRWWDWNALEIKLFERDLNI